MKSDISCTYGETALALQPLRAVGECALASFSA